MTKSLPLLLCLAFLPSMASAQSLNRSQKLLAEQLISLFENGTTEIQYAYAADLEDGRGITCGRAGFTTADGDAFELISDYVQRRPISLFRKYLATLDALQEKESASVSRLRGFIGLFKQAAKDPLFKRIQDHIQDELYYFPAISHAKQIGLMMPLGIAILYDSEIQHGDGDDPDSVGALIKKTLRNLKGRKIGVDVNELDFVAEFLTVRREDLLNPFDRTSQEEWAQSVDRVDALEQIFNNGNYNMQRPLKLHTSDFDLTIR